MYVLRVQTAMAGEAFKTDREKRFDTFEAAQDTMDTSFRRYVEKPSSGPLDGFEVVLWARMVAIVRTSVGMRLFTIHEE